MPANPSHALERVCEIDAAMRSHRSGPIGAPDLSSAETLAAWIERVRNIAFFAGARHDEISAAEARWLMPYLAPPASTSGGVIDREAIAEAAYEGFVKRNKPWKLLGFYEKECWRASADAVIASLPPTIDVEAVKAGLNDAGETALGSLEGGMAGGAILWRDGLLAVLRKSRDLLSQLTRPADDGEGGK